MVPGSRCNASSRRHGTGCTSAAPEGERLEQPHRAGTILAEPEAKPERRSHWDYTIAVELREAGLEVEPAACKIAKAPPDSRLAPATVEPVVVTLPRPTEQDAAASPLQKVVGFAEDGETLLRTAENRARLDAAIQERQCDVTDSAWRRKWDALEADLSDALQDDGQESSATRLGGLPGASASRKANDQSDPSPTVA
eukprot:gnl/TRDRNA2_/TRDRNA2_134020_c0_seq2.p1 gnl/TRDRNA2_/TRDRNA2_134020_c0~~gnl/TRDRNA2_/TRDRNA2_134020_c0_seq2.p1  ORF type:complete len:212 (-),score=32.46 gnl/TRDRNA2_/TRDRNA2_134020_c0_seq2:205-795(-)